MTYEGEGPNAYRVRAARPTNTTSTSLQAQMEFALSTAARLAARLEATKRFGDDDWEEGTVIRFDKVFTYGGKTYAYAMLKAGGLWYSTGPRAPKAFTWEEMIAWLLEGPHATTEMWVVSEYTNIDEYLNR